MATVYDSREESVRGARPLECYEFKGTFREYLYTSADIPITLAGKTFEPLPISRGAIKAGTQAEDGLDLELELPYDCPLVKDYAYAISPPDLVLTVYRTHRGLDASSQYIVQWGGPVTGINIDGITARVRVPSVFTTLLVGDIPSVYYHQPCNHVLFDSRCKVPRASNVFETTIESFQGTTIQYVEVPGIENGLFVAGEVLTALGERRSIVKHEATLRQVVVNFPFAKLSDGLGITLVAGCDHGYESPTGCLKFNNQVNFGGFPFIPKDNPFEGEL